MPDRPMNGADLLIATAVANGVDHCFANPGTTELHLVEALDRAVGMRSVLCAFEGVASGAADAYARITGRPALGLFHLGPGFANALANLHNARRHRTPMINVIGDQASWHLSADAPLTSDIALLTAWTGHHIDVASADDNGRAMSEAITVALGHGGRIANIVVPNDHAWDQAEAAPTIADVADPIGPDAASVVAAAAALRREGSLLVLDGPRVDAAVLGAADAIRLATGCQVTTPNVALLELGTQVPLVDTLPYFAAPLRSALSGVTAAVLTGRGEPVTFFGYPDVSPRALPEDAERIVLSGPDGDLATALTALCAELDVTPTVGAGGRELRSLPAVDEGPLTPRNLGQAFAAAIPENAIVIGESITSGAGYRALAPMAAPHTLLGVTGGAIGGGLPAAVGAAVAAPDRPVLALQADGSALYTIQSLWTMAREELDVTVVICANGTYNILDVELRDAGIKLEGAAADLTSLSSPAIGFVELARGFGVPAEVAATGPELEDALARAAAEPGPYLIEARLTS